MVARGDIDAALDLLSPVGDLTVRKMMGGASIYADGTIFAILDRDGALYLKASGDFAERLAHDGAEQFSHVRKDGRVGRMGYWTLPPDAVDDPDRTVALAREALSHLD